MGWKNTLLISGAILAGATVITIIIFSTEPEASRSGATKQTAMLVNVVNSEMGTFTPTISTTGTVIPSQDIILGSRVNGEIIERSPEFVPGGYVEKGTALLQIDSSDYKTALLQAQSELQQAESELQRELGLQEAAKREYELLDDTLSEANRALVLRQPQLRSVRAQVNSAQASVRQAELDLERTTIKAPFNAYILNRNVNVGSLVSPGQNLGRLVGIDEFWIEATVPLSQLRWLSFEEGEKSEVQIRNRTAWEKGETRTGQLFKMQGSLEGEMRMARVLVEVSDPMSNQPLNKDKPVLIVGSFVEANIKARPLQEVVRLNREYVRTGETVWVMENDTLSIRDVTIQFQDSQYAYITEGLEDDEKVVTTNLATVSNGAPLRVRSGSGNGDVDE